MIRKMKLSSEEVVTPPTNGQQRPAQQTVTERPGLKFSQLTQIYGEKKNTNGSSSSLPGDATRTPKAADTGCDPIRRAFVTPTSKRSENHFLGSSDEWLQRRKNKGTFKCKAYRYNIRSSIFL